MGVTLKLSTWDGKLKLWLGAFNGKGYKYPEDDEYKKLDITLKLTPFEDFKELAILSHFSQEPKDRESSKDNLIANALIYSSKSASLGFEYVMGEKSNLKYNGYSGFVFAKL